jgi:hypothetical protein
MKKHIYICIERWLFKGRASWDVCISPNSDIPADQITEYWSFKTKKSAVAKCHEIAEAHPGHEVNVSVLNPEVFTLNKHSK